MVRAQMHNCRYLYCNPRNVSEPLGGWQCTTELDTLGPAGASTQCSADYVAYSSFLWNWAPLPVPKSQTLEDSGVAGCCDVADAAHAMFWDYNGRTKNCSYGGYPATGGTPQYSRDTDGVIGYTGKYAPATCNCSRSFRTVGRRVMTPAIDIVGGYWYSHPAAGECARGKRVGDDGCTWRIVERAKAINASCMYRTIDAAVEALAPNCFGACPEPSNRTSTCYLQCFSNVTRTADVAALRKPWVDAMSGACPELLLPPL
jgi:hypothetical protein